MDSKFDSAQAEVSILRQMRAITPVDKWPEITELARQFSIVRQVRFRLTQIGYPYASGSWLDGTGDLSLLQCIGTLPGELQNMLPRSLDTLLEQAKKREGIL